MVEFDPRGKRSADVSHRSFQNITNLITQALLHTTGLFTFPTKPEEANIAIDLRKGASETSVSLGKLCAYAQIVAKVAKARKVAHHPDCWKSHVKYSTRIISNLGASSMPFANVLP